MENVRDNQYPRKGLHIAHMNVRSLLGGHKFDALKHQIRSSGIEVFSVSESWLTEAIPDKSIEIQGYSSVRWDRSWNDLEHGNSQIPKRGGGLMCYVKDEIKYSDTKYKNLNVSCKDLEMLWIKLCLKNVRPIVVVSIYRPPQGSHVKCCELISDAFERADLKNNADIFMLGDFNINFMDKVSPAFRELDFTSRALGLRQLIDTSTRTALRNGALTESTIDLLFSNSDLIAETNVLDFNVSNHLGIIATRKKTQLRANKIDFRGRSYRNYNKEVFQDNIINSEWEGFYNREDPNWLWDYLYNIILVSESE